MEKDNTPLKKRLNQLEEHIRTILSRLYHIETHLTNLNAFVKRVSPDPRLEFHALKPGKESPIQKPPKLKADVRSERPEVQRIKAGEPVRSHVVAATGPKQISIPQEIPLRSQKPLIEPKKEQKPSLSASEIVPYVLLFGFYLLLSATIYVATRLLIEWFQQGFFTSLNIFIYIYIMATLFVLSGYFVHRSLKKKQLSAYLIFPQSFIIVGIFGYFLSFILPISILSEQGPIKYLIWGIALGSLLIILILILKGIFYEFFIGESWLFIILLLFIPTILDLSFFGEYTNVLMTALFFIVISGAHILAMKGISFTPAVLTLISLSIMSFGNVFAQNVSLIIVLLVFAGFSVKWILNKDISFKSDFYENEMSQLIIFGISQILPNIGIYVLISRRMVLGLMTWELILSAMAIQCAYFVLLSSQKRKIGKIFDKTYVNFILNAIYINILLQLYLITSTYTPDLLPIEQVSYSAIWIVSLVGVMVVANKQISEIPVLLEALLLPVMILFNMFSTNIYFPLLFLLLSSLSLSWVQYKHKNTKEYTKSNMSEKDGIIIHQIVVTISLSMFLFMERTTMFASLEYFACIFLFQVAQFLTIKKRRENYEAKFPKFANNLVFITFGANMVQIFFGAVSEIYFAEDLTSPIFIFYTCAYFILSFMPIFGAKYLSKATNLMKISFQSLGLLLSQILFLINALILVEQEFALLFFLITLGHLLLAVFLPFMFPKSKEFRSFSVELLLLVLVDLWIIKGIFTITLPWLQFIEIALFVILGAITILFNISYYLHKSEKKTIRLFDQWANSKLLLAVLFVINIALTVIYRDALIYSILVISQIISLVFAILSIKIDHKNRKGTEDHYFIFCSVLSLVIIGVFTADLFPPPGFLFELIVILLFLFLLGVTFVIASNSLFEIACCLTLQYFITNYLLYSQKLESLQDIAQWVAISLYGISSLLFLYKTYKYNSNQKQNIFFSGINFLWALHFYGGNAENSLLLVMLYFMVIGKIVLENWNVDKSSSELPRSIKGNIVIHGVQLLINALAFSYLSYLMGFLPQAFWLQYGLFVIFFSMNSPLSTQSHFRNIITVISPLLIFGLYIIMRWEPSFVNFAFFFLSGIFVIISLMKSHHEYHENGNKSLLLGEIYFFMLLLSISCLITELSPDIKFGFIFTFVLVSFYLNTLYKIHLARGFQSLVVAGVGFSYVIYVIIKVGSPGFHYASLLFLLAGIGLILGSFIKYRSNLAEMKEASEDIEKDSEIVI
jgi:hypothetical protein